MPHTVDTRVNLLSSQSFFIYISLHSHIDSRKRYICAYIICSIFHRFRPCFTCDRDRTPLLRSHTYASPSHKLKYCRHRRRCRRLCATECKHTTHSLAISRSRTKNSKTFFFLPLSLSLSLRIFCIVYFRH